MAIPTNDNGKGSHMREGSNVSAYRDNLPKDMQHEPWYIRRDKEAECNRIKTESSKD